MIVIITFFLFWIGFSLVFAFGKNSIKRRCWGWAIMSLTLFIHAWILFINGSFIFGGCNIVLAFFDIIILRQEIKDYKKEKGENKNNKEKFLEEIMDKRKNYKL